MARGSITKRGKRFYIRFDVGPDPKTGRRRQRSGARGGYESRREAERALATALAAVQEGGAVEPGRMTLAQYARYWLEVARPGTVRDSTLEVNRRYLERHVLPALGSHRMAALLPGHIHAAQRDWAAAGLGAGTRRNLHALLHQILRQAVRERALAVDPMDGMRAPAAEETPRVAWTPEQLARALAALGPDPDYALWRLYALAGLRRGEALGLRWRDIDWARERLRVEQQVLRTSAGLRIGPPKNRRGRRAVDLDAGTLAALAEWRRAQNERRLAHPAWHDLDLVFPRHDGGMREPTAVSTRWTRLLRRLAPDLPAIPLHGLRHTHASILMAEDGNVRMIADRLGHDVGMLLRVYSHSREDAQRRGLARLLAAMSAPHSAAHDA